jgi:hypothetical protein
MYHTSVFSKSQGRIVLFPRQQRRYFALRTLSHWAAKSSISRAPSETWNSSDWRMDLNLERLAGMLDILSLSLSLSWQPLSWIQKVERSGLQTIA